MGARARAFIEKWLQVHVLSARRDPAHAAAVRYLQRLCVAEALEKGITQKEIEEEFGDTVETVILSAMYHRWENR
jgi:hypothetical protein